MSLSKCCISPFWDFYSVYLDLSEPRLAYDIFTNQHNHSLINFDEISTADRNVTNYFYVLQYYITSKLCIYTNSSSKHVIRVYQCSFQQLSSTTVSFKSFIAPEVSHFFNLSLALSVHLQHFYFRVFKSAFQCFNTIPHGSA